jgi:DNA-binding transcriptional ArsR family regulator
MARKEDREKALEMRKREMSYSQIKKALGISKSTLSYWLADYPLSKERIRELRDCNEQRIERYRETMRKKRQDRLDIFYKQEKLKIFPINKKELYLAGLFIYMGEGAKSQNLKQLLISNTNPAIIKFFIYWAEKSLLISRDKMSVQLHLYSDMDINKEIDFWSTTLKIKKSQFIRPYIKESLSTRINHKGAFGHGTCNLRAGNVREAERVLMALKAIDDYYIKKG